jgi:hypothetical protein
MWLFLASPIMRKIGGVLLIVLALSSVAYAIYHAGHKAGQQEEAGKETEAGKQQFQNIIKGYQDSLDRGHAREEQLTVLLGTLAQAAATARSQQQTAQQGSKADAQKVGALPDSAVKADLETKLGGPLENPVILRKADEIVTDYPHKLDELAGAKAEIAADEGSIETLKEQVTTVAGERDAAINAFNSLVPLYTQAYNAAIQGHRKWYCFFVCKKKNTLALPDPVTLTGRVLGGKKP